MSQENPSVDVLITIPLETSLINKLQEVSPTLRLTVHPSKSVEQVPDELWARCEVLYTDRVVPAPELSPEIKWIQFHWACVNRVIDEPILKQANIKATTMSGAGASQTAEYVLTMLLALGRGLPALRALQVLSEWPEEGREQYYPIELRTSTVGIVGYGSIGRQVARLLREFGCTVLASKNDAMKPTHSGYTPEETGDPDGDLVHRLYPGAAIKSMLKECNFIIVTVPFTEQTKDLIDAEVLSACKPGALFIDVSRGGITNHDALIKALESEQLGGAALDVFPEEPLPEDSPLWAMPNVIITPHLAGTSKLYKERAVDLFSENLSRFLADLPLYNLIDLQKGY